MTTKRRSKLSRRQALKLAAGAAGGLALAGLPSKWSKPVVKAGALPAHAAVSGFHTLACGANVFTYDCSQTFTSGVTITPPDAGIPMQYSVTTSFGSLLLPSPSVGTTPTNGSGTASVFCQRFFDYGTFTITWSFANAAQGSGTCVQTANYVCT